MNAKWHSSTHHALPRLDNPEKNVGYTTRLKKKLIDKLLIFDYDHYPTLKFFMEFGNRILKFLPQQLENTDGQSNKNYKS